MLSILISEPIAKCLTAFFVLEGLGHVAGHAARPTFFLIRSTNGAGKLTETLA